MEAIRKLTGVGIAQLMVLSAFGPAFADANDSEEDHRRSLGRRHAHVVSHSREDYPVILNWLTSPDTPESSIDANLADGNSLRWQG